MASTDLMFDKPQLRPCKRNGANGKSIHLHYNPRKAIFASIIQAKWKETTKQQNELFRNKADPFGIQQPNLLYSLNKRQRWAMLDDFREQLANESGSSSDAESDSLCNRKQKRRNKTKRKQSKDHKTQYSLYEYSNCNNILTCMYVNENVNDVQNQKPAKRHFHCLFYVQPPAELNNRSTQRRQKARETVADIEYHIMTTASDARQSIKVKPSSDLKWSDPKLQIKRSTSAYIKAALMLDEPFEDKIEDSLADEDSDQSVISGLLSPRLELLRLNNFILNKSAKSSNALTTTSKPSTDDKENFDNHPVITTDSTCSSMNERN